MKAKTRKLLDSAKKYCDDNDKSYAFTIQYLQDVAHVDEDTAIEFILASTELPPPPIETVTYKAMEAEEIVTHPSFLPSIQQVLEDIYVHRTPPQGVKYKRTAFDDLVLMEPIKLYEQFELICNKKSMLPKALRDAIEEVIIEASKLVIKINHEQWKQAQKEQISLTANSKSAT